MHRIIMYRTRTQRSCDDVVLRHTLPVFTGLGRCPIVNWDFAGAVSIFGPDALPVVHQWLFSGIRTRDPLEWESQLITTRPPQLFTQRSCIWSKHCYIINWTIPQVFSRKVQYFYFFPVVGDHLGHLSSMLKPKKHFSVPHWSMHIHVYV